ncbi:hypothetical protein [Paenibacillus validus]|uniref:hypothetical protein n=1 Tax=Paenibacillus validus TaxID=44253 RepID=UPI003D2B0667
MEDVLYPLVSTWLHPDLSPVNALDYCLFSTLPNKGYTERSDLLLMGRSGTENEGRRDG